MNFANSAIALQPTFIKGTISSAYNHTTLNKATITASTGLSTTSTSGTFTLRVPPNVYNLIVSSSGYLSNIQTGIHASPGQTAIVNFHLIPASTATGWIEGHVLDSLSRTPIEYALVTSDLGGVALSDNEGYFKMVAPSGETTITATAEDAASKIIHKITVSAHRTKRLVIFLERIPHSSINVSGLTTNLCSGAKIHNATVFSSSNDLAVSMNGSYNIETNSGWMTLLATAEGFQFSTKTLYLPVLPQNRAITISLQPTTDGFTKITGTVTDALTGTALENARLESDTGAICYSGSDGSYILYTNVCSSIALAQCKGYQEQQFYINPVSGSGIAHDISLAPLGHITGRVFDNSDNSSLSDVAVSLSEEPDTVVLTDTSGYYLLSDLLPGTYSLQALHGCFSFDTISVDVVEGMLTEQDIPAQRTAEGVLEGSITDAITGHPIQNAVITTGYGATLFTDDAGFFQAPLPACEQFISVSADSYIGISSKPVTVSAGEAVDIDLQLIPCPALLVIQHYAPGHVDYYAATLRNLLDRFSIHNMSSQFLIRCFYRFAPELSRLLLSRPALLQQYASVLLEGCKNDLQTNEKIINLNKK